MQPSAHMLSLRRQVKIAGTDERRKPDTVLTSNLNFIAIRSLVQAWAPLNGSPMISAKDVA
jgi:hypothetical protein